MLKFIPGNNCSATEDGRLVLRRYRMEAGAGTNDFDLQIEVHQGSTESGFSLGGEVVNDNENGDIIIRIRRAYEVATLLSFRSYLGLACDDMAFLKAMAEGIVATFALNKWMTHKTTTAVVIDWDLAGNVDIAARGRILNQKPHDILLASVTVEARARDRPWSDVHE